MGELVFQNKNLNSIAFTLQKQFVEFVQLGPVEKMLSMSFGCASLLPLLALTTLLHGQAHSADCGAEINAYVQCLSDGITAKLNNKQSSSNGKFFENGIIACFTKNGCQRPRSIAEADASNQKNKESNSDDDFDELEDVTLTQFVLNPKIFPTAAKREVTEQSDDCLSNRIKDQEKIVNACIIKSMPGVKLPFNENLLTPDQFVDAVTADAEETFYEMEELANHYIKFVRDGKTCPIGKAISVQKCLMDHFSKRPINPFQYAVDTEVAYNSWCSMDKGCQNSMSPTCNNKLKEWARTTCTCSEQTKPQMADMLYKQFKICYGAEPDKDQLKKLLTRKLLLLELIGIREISARCAVILSDTFLNNSRRNFLHEP
ncbi:hypothetical protein T4E_1374 [Trichinella pseudospiralis]|uniref:Uncharacterized protein n=1 Tax=Trichinella pseudospiralis TaxID=6337 RepID=A0A0V0YH95_TRIPS|nr:hypothetical protein T4E_1374 [Trichinella pseudospiralis]KRY89951.1 hypothetical protein T4D_906 [Trichinella pseudospiralis]